MAWVLLRRKIKSQRNGVLSLLRAQGAAVDPELQESAKQNLSDEASKRLDTIKTLNEFGIYFIMRGLTPQEFQHSTGTLKTVPYRAVYGDIGFTRCNLCLVDFSAGEKVKQFPGCDHLFHVRCLELWSILEPRCPNCLTCYNPRATHNQGALKVLTDAAANVSINISESPSNRGLREPLLR